jgi:hypothetical protein
LEKLGEEFTGFAEEAVVEEVAIGGKLGAEVQSFGLTGSMGGETGGWLDGAGCADGEENAALVESGEDLVEMEWGFAEPADVGTDFSAAGTMRNFGVGFVEVSVFERRPRTGVAAALEEFSVHVEDTAGAGLLVEIVDILRAEKETILERVFQSGQSEVGRIRLGRGGDAAAHGIKIPDEARVAAPGVGRGDLFEAIVAPEAVGIAESGDAAFRADSGTSENEDAIGRGKGQLGHDVCRCEECRTGLED